MGVEMVCMLKYDVIHLQC